MYLGEDTLNYHVLKGKALGSTGDQIKSGFTTRLPTPLNDPPYTLKLPL